MNPALEGTCLCGAARWRLDAMPASATACSCTACRRYGTLWAYGYEGVDLHISGPTTAYVRGGANGGSLSFNFCPTCGNVTHWHGFGLDAQGRRRSAVNLRLAEPGAVARIPIRHFDGLETWQDLPSDGRCVKDMWF
jgi:hypothetical protein